MKETKNVQDTLRLMEVKTSEVLDEIDRVSKSLNTIKDSIDKLESSLTFTSDLVKYKIDMLSKDIVGLNKAIDTVQSLDLVDEDLYESVNVIPLKYSI